MSIIRTWKWEVSDKEKWGAAISKFGRTLSQFDGRDFTVVWPTTGPANVRIVAITFDNWASVDIWNDWQETKEGKRVIGELGGTGKVVDRKSYEVLDLSIEQSAKLKHNKRMQSDQLTATPFVGARCEAL